MLMNRLIAGVLSAVICTAAVLPNQESYRAGHEAKAAKEKAKNASSEFDVRSTNSLGSFLKGEAAKNDVPYPLAANTE